MLGSLAAVLVAIGWLLPNHYPPWAAFHMDAWLALLMLITAWVVLLPASNLRIDSLPVLTAGMALVTVVQGFTGLVLFGGVVVGGALYLLGFSLSYWVGQEWERQKSLQAIDGLFAAVVIAAFVSVGMQLDQWFKLDALDIWSMGPGLGRPFANFGQPNQLASFLLWGVLALGWGYLRGVLRPVIAIVAALFLLWGLALTHSRTTWIAWLWLNLAAWYWRACWPDKRLPWVVLGLTLFFVASVFAVGWLNIALDLNPLAATDELGRMRGELRPTAWRMFLDAAWQRPWFGYGMNQVAIAHLMVAPDYPALFGIFAHAHNLFLDFCLWFGLPLGLLGSALVLRWFWLHGRAVRTAHHAVVFTALLIMLNHAMLELPLHYAYFLLPTGLMAGVLHTISGLQGSGQRNAFVLPRRALLAVLCGVSLLWVLVVRDYWHVENSYRELRFELANFKYRVRGTEPDVVVLTQWRDYIRMARTDTMKVLSEAELQQLTDIVSALPSPAGIYKLAAALALRQQTDKASLWLVRLCKTQAVQQCDAVRSDWQEKARTYPEMAHVDWEQLSIRRKSESLLTPPE